jgi:DNA-binding response OmpR family regulator
MANSKILIIEDDRYISRMFEIKLGLDGLDVQVADNGRIGVEKAKEFHPDVILTDILMPEMDGFEVISQTKHDPELKSTPILIMSNLGEEDHIQKGLQLGALGYIVKSDITPAQIIEKIKSIINGTYKN